MAAEISDENSLNQKLAIADKKVMGKQQEWYLSLNGV